MKFPHKRKVQHTFRYSAGVPLLTDCAACLGPGHGPQPWQWPCPGRCRGMLPVRELCALSNSPPSHLRLLRSTPSRLHVIALFTRYATLRHTLRRGADLRRLRVIVITHTHAESYTEKGLETSEGRGVCNEFMDIIKLMS